MPYSVNWFIKDEIIYAQYWGVITTEELRECLMNMQDLIESSPRHLVHTISDTGKIVEPVSLKDSLRIVREVGHHARGGWTLSINEKSLLVKMASAIGSSIFRLRYRAFDRLDQAIAYLKLVDDKLSWDKIDQSITELAKV